MMSFLKNLFGGSAPKPTLNPNQGIEQLDEKADMLQKRIEHIQAQITEQENLARQYATTNKNRAIAALKKKKQLETNLKNTEGTLDNIMNQREMLENASSNAAVLKTMSDTAKIVKQQHENLDINKVEDIVDEMREQKEISEEIANILSNTAGKQHDDEELLKELDELQQEQVNAKLINTTDPTLLPDVPQQLPAQPTSSVSKKKETTDELDELKKWASPAQ